MHVVTADGPEIMTQEVLAAPSSSAGMLSTRAVFHDLRKLAQGVVGPADTLEVALEEGDIQLARTSLGRLRDNADRVVEMLGYFMSAPRTDTAEKTRCDVAQTVENVVNSLASLLKRKGIQVCRTIAPPVTVLIERMELQRILLNLLVNAIEATDGCGAPISIVAKPVGDEWVEITVRDAGSGIAKEDLAHIFEEGYTTKAEHGGNGLGLATVKRIAEANYGTVHVQSRPGKGACFKVKLPNGQDWTSQ